VEDLFPAAEETRKPWSVTRLNREVRACLEGSIGPVWIEGEISNLRRQPSGHQYFSLKDEACQVSCVLFRGAGASAPALRDGIQVELSGQISVYEPRGQYQVVVRRVQPRGAGELEAKLRALQENKDLGGASIKLKIYTRPTDDVGGPSFTFIRKSGKYL